MVYQKKKLKNKVWLLKKLLYLCSMEIGTKVKIKHSKQVLTLTGDKFVHDNVEYLQVKERDYFIPKNKLIKVIYHEVETK